jgi:glutaminase
MEVSELAHRRLFDALDQDRDGQVWAWELLSRLGQAGIQPSDPRLRSALADLRDPDGRPLGIDSQPIRIDYQQFTRIAEHGDGVVQRALQGELAVSPSEFMDFAREIARIHEDLQDNRDGEVAQYIPTLKNADPDRFGIALCTADGQLYQVGDAELGFSVQSTSKPFNYAKALQQLGPEEVHRWVGQEQSGGTFNDFRLSLDQDRTPHNPMINAGAMATLALVDTGRESSDRLASVQDTWARMTGRRPPLLDGATYLAERDTGHGNRGLASLMAAEGRLKGVRASDAGGPAAAADFYFQVCSLEVDAVRLAAAGSTLANGGVAPYSGERVFSQETVGRVLSVMGHSGMYNDSGKFADLVGLPAKSGVSGNVMMVVPEKRLAVVVFSPRLDPAGNSVRGVEACRQLVDRFGLHPYKRLGAERGTEMSAADAMRRAFGGVAPAGAGAEGHHNPAAPATTSVTRAEGLQL